MYLENDQWNIADEEFSLWMNGTGRGKNIELTNILKSTFLVFREKKRSWLEEFCKRSLDYLIEVEREKKDDSFRNNNVNFSLIPVKENLPDDILSDNVPMFRIASERDEPGYWERIRNEENDIIINGIFSGDQNVFNELYEDEFPKVVKLIINNSGSVDVAKDVFQDALVILIEKVYTKKLDLTCTVSTYLYSICRFLWMDQLRQSKREVPLKDEYSYNNAEITVVGFENTPDIYEHVNIAIETLGEPCKELLECFYYKNLSWAEIASKLGYANAASARNQKYKCLERIRKTVNVEVE